MLEVPHRALLAALLTATGLAACGGAARGPNDGVPQGGDLSRGAPAAAAPHAGVDAGAFEGDGGLALRAADGGAPAGEELADEDHEGPEDYQAPHVEPSEGATRPRAPVLDLADGELAAKVRSDLASLGAMSIGRTNAGALVNGIPLPESPYWERVSPGAAWCTEETRDYLTAALAAVHPRFPDAPKVYVGNVSTRNGGTFPPHVSHQSGRDVDVSYFLAKGHVWYAAASAQNLDLERTWAFVRALATETDVEMIFVDRRLQLLLHAHAIAAGEDRAWVDSLFQYGGGSARPLVMHVRGHLTHMHVRFRSPVAEELGRRAYPFLLRRGVLRPPTFFAKHVVKKGETLSHLALRYATPIDVIKKTNGLKKDFLREGKEYRIPQKGGVVASTSPVLVLPRRLPPQASASDTARRASASE